MLVGCEEDRAVMQALYNSTLRADFVTWRGVLFIKDADLLHPEPLSDEARAAIAEYKQRTGLDPLICLPSQFEMFRKAAEECNP